MEIELVARRWADAGKALDRFDAMLDGECLVTSRDSVHAAARELLARGFAPETLLEFRHRGVGYVATRGQVGELARWTVTESDKSGLRRVLWQPFPGRASG